MIVTLTPVKTITSRALVVTTAALAALAMTTGSASAHVEPGTPVAHAEAPPADDLAAWAESTSAVVDVPRRALLAYGAADLALRESCGLTWNTLAAIGDVESDHGRFGEARLDEEGVAQPLIIGLPLDGRPGIMRIGDSDDGALDGDREFDRAVGPMQFIPGTWAEFGVDGDGDGAANPHDLDDAALATAHHLCAGGRDLTDGADWWEALYGYNRSLPYGQRVHEVAGALAES